ncbi:MAG: hypothetical protein AABZ44_00795 [Elusimicrobiota bacterium]
MEQHHLRDLIFLLVLGCVLSSCGTISTFQTGKTIPQKKVSFGMGSSVGLTRTKSNLVGYPIELPYGSIEAFLGYGLFDFLDINVKAMAAQYARPSEEGSKKLRGLPFFGGASARLAMVQERWGHPVSVALGYGYYTGAAQSRQTDLNDVETKKESTTLTDKVVTVNCSRDVFKWLTFYGAWKLYERHLVNNTFEYKIQTLHQEYDDKMDGYGAGVSFNVGREHNTHIMIETNQITDTDEPTKHYQKQVGLGMSVDF